MYRASVLKFLRGRVRSAEAADALVDDVLMSVLVALRRGAVRSPERIGAFVHGVAVHAASGYLRGRLRSVVLLPLDWDVADPGQPDRQESDERVQSLLGMMPALGATDRRILQLLLGAGASEAEVARRLGMTLVAVRQRKCRLVRRLARLAER
ncbi:MAG TPA: sigma-70 family RNA polymerase sigma factor [Steroidobacteraceae bacterium]